MTGKWVFEETVKMGGAPSDSRFRSFAERYIISRAPFFRVGFEAEDGWACLMDAKRLYKMIDRAGTSVNIESPLDHP